LNFDASLLVIMGLFWVTYFIIRRNFVSPMMELIEGRRREIDTAQEAYDQTATETEARIDEQRGRFADARLRARARREEIRRAAQDSRRSLLGQAKTEAQSQLGAASDVLAQQIAKEKSRLEESTRSLASVMASRLLGRSV
jgi:F0F1-type ATP synthase membrane subunit b/b'